MPDFDSALDGAASAILKRPLTDGERMEFRGLADTIGMGSVEDYLYMLMVFKRSEDRINAGLAEFRDGLGKRFDEMSELEKKINGTLEGAIERALGEGAGRIGAEMGESIAAQAEETLASYGEYRSVRGQVMLACLTCLTAAVSYWLGAAGFLESVQPGGGMEALLFLPAGWCVFFSGAAYTFLWAGDHWGRIKGAALYKALLGVQILLLSALAAKLS
jgi:hypothetical protein